MKPKQNRRYFIFPDSQANESIMDLLRQASVTIDQRGMLCADGKRRNLIEVTYDELRLLRSEKLKGGGCYSAFRMIGEGRPKKFDDATLEKTVAKAANTKSKARASSNSEALARLRAKPGICLGSELPAS